MNVRALVIDDEPLARRRLCRILGDNAIEVVAEGENGQQAVDLVEQHSVDVVFLDINMPLKNGIQAAKEIVALSIESPAIIFCTAYDEFAIDAFKVQAVGYLLKPVNANDLIEAVEKATHLSRLQVAQLLESQGVQANKRIMTNYANTIENHSIEEIVYFRAEQKNVFAGLKDGREIVVGLTLKSLEEKFINDLIRAHRNTLVNKSYISKLLRDEAGTAVLQLEYSEENFTVSRRHLANIKQCFRGPNFS